MNREIRITEDAGIIRVVYCGDVEYSATTEMLREVALLAPGYRRIHQEALERIAPLSDADLEREMTYFDGDKLTVHDVLWEKLLHHMIHHRAQLVLLCRMAGGTPPGIYGPNREEMRAIQERMQSGGTT